MCLFGSVKILTHEIDLKFLAADKIVNRLAHVGDIVAFVLSHDAFRAHVHLIILAEILCAFIKVSEALLLGLKPLLLGELLLCGVSGVDSVEVNKVVKDDEIFCKLFHIGTKVAPASWTHQNIAFLEVQEAALAECVAAHEHTRHSLTIIVAFMAD